MPSITLPNAPNGPLLQVVIGISAPHRHALEAEGKTVPKGVIGTFLVDTGASCTCVDPDFVGPLNLVATGLIEIQTPSTNGDAVTCLQYDVSLLIPSDTGVCLSLDAMPVLETHLRSQGIEGLIGRDVLSRCVLIYNGASNILTLAG